jgi:cytochrome c-type biogenesis protein
VPFILAGLAFRRFVGAVGVWAPPIWVTRFGGLFLVVLGVLLLTGAWDALVAGMRGAISGFVPVI